MRGGSRCAEYRITHSGIPRSWLDTAIEFEWIGF
jgi:hypothetical protein